MKVPISDYQLLDVDAPMGLFDKLSRRPNPDAFARMMMDRFHCAGETREVTSPRTPQPAATWLRVALNVACRGPDLRR